MEYFFWEPLFLRKTEKINNKRMKSLKKEETPSGTKWEVAPNWLSLPLKTSFYLAVAVRILISLPRWTALPIVKTGSSYLCWKNEIHDNNTAPTAQSRCSARQRRSSRGYSPVHSGGIEKSPPPSLASMHGTPSPGHAPNHCLCVRYGLPDWTIAIAMDI